MKNTIPFVFIVSLFLFFFSSCDRKSALSDTTIVRGYLLEYGTEDPLPDVAVYLQECGGEFGSFGCWTVDTFYTNDEGFFYHEFQHESPSYQVSFSRLSDYYEVREIILNTGKSNERIRYADPYAYIMLHIKNIDPYNIGDYIEYSGGWAGGSSMPLVGESIDSFILKDVMGNRTQFVNWWVTKDGQSQNFSDTLYCPAHDTMLFEIFY